MPVPLVVQVLSEGLGDLSWLLPIVKIAACLGVLFLLKTYFNGARNTSERNMHSKVVMITGGTSGIGASVALELAKRGAQLVLLVQQPLADPFLVDYIMDLRTQSNNELITVEQVDLGSLHSIRLFATKWVDNAPPRRLDMLILCANTLTPKRSSSTLSADGIESTLAINYLANFHLMSLLSPAIRAQPADRDVRILFAACSSYMGGEFPEENQKQPPNKKETAERMMLASAGSKAYQSSKYCLLTFADAFQKHLSAHERQDKAPTNSRVLLVDPGWCRTPGMRRYLTGGTLLGLAVYLLTWPLWWLLLKSPAQGAQTFLYAAMEAEFGRGEGGQYLKECREVKIYRNDIRDESKQKKLWGMSDKMIEGLEKDAAVRRATAKQEKAKMTKEAHDKKDDDTTATAAKKPGSRRSRKA